MSFINDPLPLRENSQFYNANGYAVVENDDGSAIRRFLIVASRFLSAFSGINNRMRKF